MSTVSGRTVDRNRFSKKYSLRRAPSRLTFQGDATFAIELGSLKFKGESEKVFTFEVPFENDQYTIMATPRDTKSNSEGSANVNVYVDNATFSRNSVTIKASMAFHGVVDVLAIKVG